MNRNNLKSPIDFKVIRNDFPILGVKINGKSLCYLDNAASAQKPKVVMECMTRMMETTYSNVHRGLHHLSNTSTQLFEQARVAAQKFLGASSERSIVFTRNATEAINLVAQSYLSPNISEGDEIVLSIMEHHSNIIPWHFLRERHGAVIRWAPIDDKGNLLVEEFEKLLNSRTKMVAMTMMSNTLGTRTPVENIIAMCQKRGIATLIDGAQAAVHERVSVESLGCDFFVCTGHKLYGPSGIGLLYGKVDHLDNMRPYQGGGEMIDIVEQERVTYARSPQRFEAGTPAILEAVGLSAALQYIEEIGRENIAQHEQMLLAYATEELRKLGSFRIFGEAENKGAILSFAHCEAHAHDISAIVDQEGVAVRAGTHCTMPLLKRLGVSSTCRASFGMYNTIEEVDQFINALKKVDKLFAV